MVEGGYRMDHSGGSLWAILVVPGRQALVVEASN